MAKFMVEDLNFIKKFVVIEFCILAMVITCGGIAYGAESGRWSQTFICMAGLFVATAVVMGMKFKRGAQRCKVFNHR